eukprot:633660-Prymnesium_polylepis.1
MHGKRKKRPKPSRARGALISRATPSECTAPEKCLHVATPAAETPPEVPMSPPTHHPGMGHRFGGRACG